MGMVGGGHSIFSNFSGGLDMSTQAEDKVAPFIAKEVAAASKPKKASKLKAVAPHTASPSKPKVLIYGLPGVGKTWTSMDFPSVYYIDTEGGANLTHYTDKLKKSGGVYFGPDEGAQDFKEVIYQVKALATEEHPYKTLVIDSVSKIFNTVIANEAARLGSADQYGASKKPAVSYTRQLINWLDRLDMNVILIAHQKPLWGIDAKGQRAEIGTTFDAYDKLEYELHLCLNITKEGDSRKARVRKTRLQGFPDGLAFEWSYPKFAELYGKDVMEKKSEAIKLATEAQIKEFNTLLETIKVAEDWQEKCLTKFKAAKIEELDSDKLDKMIEFLKGKKQ